MGESELHRTLKNVAAKRLSEEGYEVEYELPYPPTDSLSWSRYRPDVIGVERSRELERYAVIECETNPSPARIARKFGRRVLMQHKLTCHINFRRILVLPKGKLRWTACTMLKENCELWIINTSSGSVLKLH